MTVDHRQEKLTRLALEENRVLAELLRTIDRYVRAETESLPGGALDALAEHVRRHFDLEDEMGLFEVIQRRLPGSEQAVAKLEEEHGEILARLGALQSAERDPAGGPPSRTSIRQLVDDLRSHETREAELFQKCYTLDVGEKD